MKRDAIVTALEYRSDKPYDEQSVGHLIMPNGSVVGSIDRQFMNAADRYVLDAWDVTAASVDHEGADAA